MMKIFLRTFLISVLVAGLGFLVSVFGLENYFSHVAKETVQLSKVMVDIPYGSSIKSVARLLAEKGVVTNGDVFYWYLRLARDDSNKIQAGFYQFDGTYTLSMVAESLKYGRDRAYEIVFREGQTLVDLAGYLKERELASEQDFISAMTNPDILALIQAPFKEQRKNLRNDVGGIEGYLFPDTYFFTRRDTAKSVISMMYRQLLSKFDDAMKARMRESGMDLHQVLTLASIVEKETGAESERPVIASVYLNRLQKGMRLQADPTVIYGIKDYDGKIRKKDLLTPHSYNTYTMAGLPPGPIASPGLKAIKAVLWPEQTKFLYFVSRNDGTHEFCESLECHNQAVKKWQIDYFKSASRVQN